MKWKLLSVINYHGACETFLFNCFLLEFSSLLYDKMTGHFGQNFRKWNFDSQRFKTLKERHRKKFLDLHIFSNFIISFSGQIFSQLFSQFTFVFVLSFLLSFALVWDTF